MGGGTGTGSAALVAEIAKESGALTIAIITIPFTYEGSHRNDVAKNGITKLLPKVDTLLIIPNDKLLDLCNQKTSIDSAFKMADEVIKHGVQAISEVITGTSPVKMNFADVKAVMKNAGPAWMSVGRGTGKNRAIDAAKEALSSPLLDVTIDRSKGVLFNVVGGSNLSLCEVNEAAEVIRQAVDQDANIVFGVNRYEQLLDEVYITLN
jgi:cell division protein FtsZ